MQANYRGSVIIDIIHNERFYSMIVPSGTPYDEAREVSLKFAEAIIEMQKNAQAAEAAANKPSEEVQAEVVNSEATYGTTQN